MRLLDKKIISILLLFLFLFTGCEKQEEKEYVSDEGAVIFGKIIEEVDLEKLTFFESEEGNNMQKVGKVMLDNVDDYNKGFNNLNIRDNSSFNISYKKEEPIGYTYYVGKFNLMAEEEDIEKYKRYNKGFVYDPPRIYVQFKTIRYTDDTIIGNEDDYYEYELECMEYTPEDYLDMDSIIYDFSEKSLSDNCLTQILDEKQMDKKTRKRIEKYLGKKIEELYENCTSEDAYKLITSLINECGKRTYF